MSNLIEKRFSTILILPGWSLNGYLDRENKKGQWTKVAKKGSLLATWTVEFSHRCQDKDWGRDGQEQINARETLVKRSKKSQVGMLATVGRDS